MNEIQYECGDIVEFDNGMRFLVSETKFIGLRFSITPSLNIKAVYKIRDNNCKLSEIFETCNLELKWSKNEHPKVIEAKHDLEELLKTIEYCSSKKIKLEEIINNGMDNLIV